MLTISDAKLKQLAVIRERQFLQRMRARFADSLTADEAEKLLERARSTYGLQYERDLIDFLTFCEESGADFESRPETVWIARDLVDPSIGPPSLRLTWVRQRKAHFAAIVQQNRAQREEFLK